MAVGGEREADAVGLGVALGLLQAVGWRKVAGLGLDESDCDGLGLGVHADAEDVVCALVDLACGAAGDDDMPGGLLAAYEVLRPAALMQGRVNELRSGIGFAKCHRRSRVGKRTAQCDT